MRAAEICEAMADVAGLPLGLKLFAIIDRYEGPDGTGGALVYGDQGFGAPIPSLTATRPRSPCRARRPGAAPPKGKAAVRIWCYSDMFVG